MAVSLDSLRNSFHARLSGVWVCLNCIFQDYKFDHSSRRDDVHYYQHQLGQLEHQEATQRNTATRAKTKKELWSPARELEQRHRQPGTASVLTYSRLNVLKRFFL